MRNWDNHGVTSLAGTTPLVESPSQNVYPRCGATGVYWSEDTSLFHWQTRWYLRVPSSECGPCILASVCIIKGALWECVNVIIKHSTFDQYPSFPERWWKTRLFESLDELCRLKGPSPTGSFQTHAFLSCLTEKAQNTEPTKRVSEMTCSLLRLILWLS